MKKRAAPRRGPLPCGEPACYLVVLPEPELVPVLPEPELPAPVVLSVLVLPLAPAPVLGVLGVPAAPPVVVLPVAPAPAPVSDLKCSSHSEREIWPSLFLSTSEKFGIWVLAPAPAAAPPVAPVSLEVLPVAPVLPVALVSLEVLPVAPVLPDAPVVALGVCVSALEPDAPDDPAAWTTPAIASSAALVATPISLSLNICVSSKVKGCGPFSMQSPCRARRQTGMFGSGIFARERYR